MKNAVIVFVKNLVLGKVKTRLAKTIGPKKALEIYQYLVTHTQTVCKAVHADVFIFYSDFIDDSNQWNSCDRQLQNGNNLGEKMHNAFSKVFQNPAYEQAVIIGSDCLEITTTIIEEAFDQLINHDVVIGPATDGGYYLLGMKKLHSTLFKDKDWSSAIVLQQTISSIKNLGLSYFLLPELNDIDEEKDLAGTNLLHL